MAYYVKHSASPGGAPAIFKEKAMIGTMTNDEYVAKVLAFHGHIAPGLLLGGHMVEQARAQLHPGTLFDVICESGQCLPDAVQMLTPCTVGNGWLKIRDCGLFALVLYDKYTGAGVRVWLDPEKLKKFPTSYEWFYKLKAKKEQDGDALRTELLEHGAEMLSLRPVQVHSDVLKRKSRGGITTCPACGEAYPASLGEKCPLCANGRDYDLL